MNKLLLDDIAENPHLRKLFSNNPQLLESYCNMAGSNYRKDITMLRYVGENANKARENYTLDLLRKESGYPEVT